jgi:hypothetical protein
LWVDIATESIHDHIPAETRAGVVLIPLRKILHGPPGPPPDQDVPPPLHPFRAGSLIPQVPDQGAVRPVSQIDVHFSHPMEEKWEKMLGIPREMRLA